MGKCSTLQCCIHIILCVSAAVAGITRIPTHLNQNCAAIALDTEGGTCIVWDYGNMNAASCSTLGWDKSSEDAVPLADYCQLSGPM